MLHRFGLYILIAIAPLLLGSNRVIFWGLNGALAALSITAFCLSEFRYRHLTRFDWTLPLITTGGILVISGWMVVQTAPWTPAYWHHPIWTFTDAQSAISANPSQTLLSLGWWSTLAVFIVAVRAGTHQRRRLFLLSLMMATGAVVAVLGLFFEFYDLNTVGLQPKTAYIGWLTGTFVNRNTAASFLAINLVIAVALFSRELIGQRYDRIHSVFDWIDLIISRKGLYCAVAILLFSTLLMTGSRGGISVGILGTLLVLVLRFLKRKRRSHRLLPFLGILTLAVCAIGLASLIFYGRIDDTVTSTAVRLSLYREALQAIADRPFLGHGAGTYSTIQPLYHSATTPSQVIWNHAHSTVLESIVCLGIPAAFLAMAVLGYLVYRLARFWREARSEMTCTLAALGVAISVTVHSFFDSSLEVQAVALYVATLVGLGMGETIALSSRYAISSTPPDPHPQFVSKEDLQTT